ncbi:MAG: hypothetical protein HUK40_06595 [Desulfobacter sp.]|nr:hypothetical protein [Desulfobacter sp.]WDP84882.1 MAG: hypothetical protein HUN05_06725 [Desulfobacter sp.]
MDVFTLVYILNATLLLLHEIESAYEKEWEILKLPGKISGFLLMHLPIIILLFYGVIEVEKKSVSGIILAAITGVSGLLPFIVHKLVFKKKDRFNRGISNLIIYLNLVTGLALLFQSWAAFP